MRANLHEQKLAAEWRLTAVVLAALALVPLAVSSPYWLGVLIVSMYFAMLATGWNLLAGYAGQFSLAPAAFAMLGGYVPALLSYHWKLPLYVGLPAAIVATALVGMVLGRIVLRLAGPYLALTTLSFAEILRVVIGNSYEFTRGDQGLNAQPLVESHTANYYLLLGALAATIFAIYRLLRGRTGRFLLAIRDDQIGAQTRGINITRWKTLAFALSCGICGLAGALYGTFSRLVSPEMGLVLQTGLVISMVVIGGMGTLVGPLVGALLVYVTSEWLRDFGGIQMIVFALLVIVFARFFREGLWGIVRGRWVLRRRAEKT